MVSNSSNVSCCDSSADRHHHILKYCMIPTRLTSDLRERSRTPQKSSVMDSDGTQSKGRLHIFTADVLLASIRYVIATFRDDPEEKPQTCQSVKDM